MESLDKKVSLIGKGNERAKESHGEQPWKVSDWEDNTLSMEIDRIDHVKRFGYLSN
jgi:hypothetical protein